MITKYKDVCIICGRPATEAHHLIGGTANRKKADKHGLTIPVCRECHNFIHTLTKLHILCHIIAQLFFEKKAILQGYSEEEARNYFRKEFGKSWL